MQRCQSTEGHFGVKLLQLCTFEYYRQRRGGVCRDFMRRMESKLSDLLSWLHISLGGRQVVCVTSDPGTCNTVNRTYRQSLHVSVS